MSKRATTDIDDVANAVVDLATFVDEHFDRLEARVTLNHLQVMNVMNELLEQLKGGEEKQHGLV